MGQVGQTLQKKAYNSLSILYKAVHSQRKLSCLARASVQNDQYMQALCIHAFMPLQVMQSNQVACWAHTAGAGGHGPAQP